MPKQNRTKSKSHKTKDNSIKKKNYQQLNKVNKPSHTQANKSTKSIDNIEFDKRLFELKERQVGASGRNKAKKSFVSNIIIQSPILAMTTIEKPKSIIDALLVNEESDKIEKNVINRKFERDISANKNVFAVLGEEEAELNITIMPSILQLGTQQRHDEEEIDPDI